LTFLRVIEVFPPFIPDAKGAPGSELQASVDSFVSEVKAIRGIADIVLVASLKSPPQPTLSTIEASLILRKKLGVDAAPVLVVRDQDRLQFLSSVVAGLVGGLKSMMLVWGDADLPRRSPRLIGFAGLSDALLEASRVREKARSRCVFLAPVDLRRLFTVGGSSLAKERVAAGATLLLAQPPTTDAEETFETHARLIAGAGLAGKVLQNVFPFRSPKDVSECETYFGWKVPQSVLEAAGEGEASVLAIQREVVRRLRAEHCPGVYVSTRGTPAVAKEILS